MLNGVKVLEIGDTLASSAAGAIYQRLGAEVTKMRAPRSGQGAGRWEGTQRGRLAEILDRGKTFAEVPGGDESQIIALAARSEITVSDVSESGYWEERGGLEPYKDLVRRANANSWVSISPFGLDGPLSGYRGTELTAAASGGVVRYMRSSLGRPMKPAGFTTSITTGHLAALAGLHGVLRRRSDPAAVHLDLSAQDSVIVTGVFLEVAHRVFECAGDGGAARYAAPRGLIPCGTGYIWIVVIEDHQWRGCIRAMGEPSWAEGITGAAEREANYELIQTKLAEWASSMPAREVAERLQACGVPATSVNSAGDLLSGTGLDVKDDFFIPGERPGERLPDVPFGLIPTNPGAVAPPRPPGEPRRFRVLDLSQVLVGPLSTSWLGAMGVDVLKPEDPERLDIYRRKGPFLDGIAGPDRGAYFSFANYSKRSHTVEMTTPLGRRRLKALIASSDAVVHNLGRRAEAIGVTPDSVSALGSFLVSCSGFGRTTAYAGNRAYGMNIQAAGGVVYLSRDREHQPVNMGTSWADASSAVWIAILTVSQLLAPAAERQNIDVSMVEVVAHHFKEYFAALSADGIELLADESRLDHASPHGIYRSRGDDQWIAVDVESDRDWEALVEALGRPEELSRAGLAGLTGRLAAQDELDATLDRLFSAYGKEELFELLQASGIACAPVWGGADFIGLEHLRKRGLFQEVVHPEWGERPLIGLPWQVDGKPQPISRTPMLGEHTSDDPDRWWND
jgi:crotonobetainyl-CoA:carnitine CoA-transferase CaiB-like acyl-CoA transferase